MIARVLISPTLDIRIKEINKILASHLMGSPRSTRLATKRMRVEAGEADPNHPDVLYFPASSKLGIEQARMIKQHFFLKPYSAKGKAVVLEDASALTFEAQNSLLKILEEPPLQALLILAAPSDAKLLPTVLSRVQITHIKNPTSHRTPTSEVGYEKDVEKLLSSSIEDRFGYIERLKNREEFLHFLLGYFHQNLRSHLKGTNLNFLKELLQAEEWAAQNVNIRAILEYLMLVMPKLPL